ncbi:MAG: hypothetical protein Q7R52_03085 [archaeon]|nr:hypothetical protein [archaeon]
MPLKGYKQKEEHKRKISENYPDNSFDKNPMWKGDDVGYSGVHNWIFKKKGKPNICENCGENDVNKNYEWSNKSGQYKRRLDDWQRLCVPCHRRYDKKQKNHVCQHKRLI